MASWWGWTLCLIALYSINSTHGIMEWNFGQDKLYSEVIRFESGFFHLFESTKIIPLYVSRHFLILDKYRHMPVCLCNALYVVSSYRLNLLWCNKVSTTQHFKIQRNMSNRP